MNLFLVPLLFFIWRTFDFLVILLSQKVIPYLGFFPYKDRLPGYNLPSWLSSLANFDGIYYISIARHGYSQYEQAFFPLYPMLIKFLTPLFLNNQLLTGIIISNVLFLLGLFVFYRYLKLILSDSIQFYPILSILFLLVFPTSFFFGAVYTEGLFFFLLISSLYFLKKERYLLVVIFAFLASLTRLIGVFLIIPILFHLIEKSKVKSQNLKLKLKSFLHFILNTKYLILLISPLLGLALYCFYLWKTTGDPFFFLTSQPIFGANRSSHLILLPQVYWRYFKIFVTASHDFRFYISIVEVAIFSFVLLILTLDLIESLQRREKIKNFDRLALNLFSFANLILPTLTGTFSSIPRYSLFSISFFIYLAQVKNIFIKYLILVIFIFLHILLLGYFTQGYFIS